MVNSIKFLLCILFLSHTVAGQQTLNITLVSHNTGADDPLVPLFTHLIDYIKQADNSFTYTKISTKKIDYLREPNLVRESTIGTIKAGDFIRCKKTLGADALKPIFIVQKVDQTLPYYSAYFISNKSSGITSFDPEKELTLYLVDENSVSGYISPLTQLCAMGIIKYPTMESFSSTKWDVKFASDHQGVLGKVSGPGNVIGALSELPADMSNYNILLRYDLIPQDVIFISQNLSRYEPLIKEWFNSNSNAILDTLRRSSSKITGFQEFQPEHRMAYFALEEKINRVRDGKEIPTMSFDSPYEAVITITKQGWATQTLIYTFIAGVFSLGVLMGTRYSRVLKAIKGEKDELNEAKVE